MIRFFHTLFFGRWRNNSKRKPKLGGEYLVVWDLRDGEKPEVTVMDYDVKKNQWRDVLGADGVINDRLILYWSDYPKTPGFLRGNPRLKRSTFDRLKDIFDS